MKRTSIWGVLVCVLFAGCTQTYKKKNGKKKAQVELVRRKKPHYKRIAEHEILSKTETRHRSEKRTTKRPVNGESKAEKRYDSVTDTSQGSPKRESNYKRVEKRIQNFLKGV